MLPDIKVWLDHFEYHAQYPRCVPEGVSNTLTADEQLIAKSIARFQADKGRRAQSLEKAMQCFAGLRDAKSIVRIIELQIREDRHHASLLRAFMEAHGLPLARRGFVARLRALLYSLAGPELCLSLRVTAELIGQVQHRALETSTRCQHLRVLCRMLVADELAHAAFQSDLLLAIRAQRFPLVRGATHAVHRSFFLGMTCLTWQRHRALLRRAGYSLGSFIRTCGAQYSFYLKSPASAASVPGYR